jgi:hypothetical protein
MRAYTHRLATIERYFPTPRSSEEAIMTPADGRNEAKYFLIEGTDMAYRSSSEYFNDIQQFINELGHDGKTEASKSLKACYDYINQQKNDWKMFYRKLLLMKDEFGFKFTKDEDKRMDDIIEAAKRIMYQF